MNASPSFSWDQIESADYHEYVANLRAVGCPEQVIRDLVTAELNQLFAPRAGAIWPQRCRLYWQKHGNERPGPDQVKQLQAFHKEQAATFKEITGAGFEPQSFIDALFVQVWGAEQELLFLPEERQRAALQALAASDYQVRVMIGEWEDQDYSHSDEFFEDKCRVLAAVLTPAELEEYRLRNSRATMGLRAELQYFDCTPEEFKALLKLRAEKPNARRRFGDPAARAQEVRSLFGEERANEFVRVTDPFYANARRIAEEHALPVERAERAWQVTHEARTEAGQVAADASLSAEARDQRLQELLQAAEADLKGALGEKPSRSLRRDLATVLRPPEVKPGCCGNRP